MCIERLCYLCISFLDYQREYKIFLLKEGYRVWHVEISYYNETVINFPILNHLFTVEFAPLGYSVLVFHCIDNLDYFLIKIFKLLIQGFWNFESRDPCPEHFCPSMKTDNYFFVVTNKHYYISLTISVILHNSNLTTHKNLAHVCVCACVCVCINNFSPRDSDSMLYLEEKD